MKLLTPFLLGALVCAGSASASTPLGTPFGVILGGGINNIVIDPVTPSTLYGGSGPAASMTGIYKSTDSGVHWTLVYPRASAPYDIELDPQNPSILYMAEGTAGSPAVIQKSTDGGATWSAADNGILPVTHVFAKDWIARIAVDPVNEGVVYAVGGNTGLYKSLDGGQNWTSIDSGFGTLIPGMYQPSMLFVDPAAPGTVYFLISTSSPTEVPSGLYKSVDGGATWAATGLTGANISLVALDPSNHTHLLANVGGVLSYSTDGGVTWASGATGGATVVTLAIDPANSNHILLGSNVFGVLPSFDGGNTIKFGTGLGGVDVMSIAFDPVSPANIYVGTVGTGIYISRDGGTTWTRSTGAFGPVLTIHVPADQPTIQAAINAAWNGDTIIVAPGTYYEKLDFLGKAVAVESSGGAEVTTLDGNNSGPIVTFDTGEGNASVLEGFTLTHAHLGSSGSTVLLLNASPTIIDDVFEDNASPQGGSGTLGGNGASPIIMWDLFTRNSCVANFLSGVLAFVNGSSPTIVDNVFLNNSCGAIGMTVSASTAYVSNNTFVGNSAGIHGTLRATQTFRNNVFFDNGVGLDAAAGSVTTGPNWKNNLVFGSTTANYQGISDQTGINGNLSADPQFADIAHGSIKLAYGSPAIDAGDMGSPALPMTDYDGEGEPFAGIPGGPAVVDIGASEYHPPVISAVPDGVAVPVDSPKDAVLRSANSDPDEPLVYTAAGLPQHGTVTVKDASTGVFEYVPVPGYSGLDSFTFTVTDPFGTVSDAATESVNVGDVAAAAAGGNVTTKADVAAGGTLVAAPSYPEQVLKFSLVSQPSHGSVDMDTATGQFTYTPATGFAGTDSFSFAATDQYELASNTAVVQIEVDDIAPSVADGSLSLNAGTVGNATLSAAASYAGQVLTYSVQSQPAHGTVALTAATGHFTYTPAGGFAGSDSFSFQVTDAFGTASNTATEQVTVKDLAPFAYSSSALTGPDTGISAYVLVYVTYAGQTLSYAVVGQPTHGGVVLDPSTGYFTYTPTTGFVGGDSFSFQLTDAYGTKSNTGAVSITVSDATPTAVAGTLDLPPGTATDGALSATATYAGQTLSFSVVSQPVHGGLDLDAGTGHFTYTPAASFQGTDGFTFKVTDQYGAVSNTATEQLNVTDVMPVANDGSVQTASGFAVTDALSATRAYPAQKLSFSLVSTPAHGVVSLTAANGQFKYTPATGFAGSDSFTFQVTDAFGKVSNVATESITVNDAPPKANAALIKVVPGRLYSGNLNATKAYSGQILTYSVVSRPLHGTLTITDPNIGAFTYTALRGYVGKDSFTFQVTDQWGAKSNVATITVALMRGI